MCGCVNADKQGEKKGEQKGKNKAENADTKANTGLRNPVEPAKDKSKPVEADAEAGDHMTLLVLMPISA
jgi:hypothetical protein